MSSLILSLLSSHLLTVVEDLIVASEPTVVAEIQLLISKLENYISGKSAAVAAVVNPDLNEASADASSAVSAAATTLNNALSAAVPASSSSIPQEAA